MRTYWKLVVSVLIPLLILWIPQSWFPMSLTVIEQRVMAIFMLACLCWLLETIPVYATSLLVTVLELLLISDQSFVLFRGQAGDASFGTVLKYQDIMATFASPLILLFLGGFFLAMATTKYRLDLNLARTLLKPFGSDPKWILLGLMTITAIFSMFMSNTATTAMMFAIVSPVLASLDPADKGRAAFVLSIPFAANIGGIGTPIGTPPNIIGLGYLKGDQAVSFAQWMGFGVPLAIVMTMVCWLVLIVLFPIESKKLEIKIGGKFMTHWRAVTMYITFGVTVILWMLDSVTGMNSYVVGMIPVGVFTVTQIIDREDMKRISWDVLWLVTGGIALGLAMDKSGLSKSLVDSIPFTALSPFMILILCTGLTFLMSNFMSHTATANLLLPIVAALGVTLPELNEMGGSTLLILAVALTSSMSMILPISTPPNAIAYASGMVNTAQMQKAGLVIGIIGIVCVYGTMYILNLVGFF